jgi:hypothetical protein
VGKNFIFYARSPRHTKVQIKFAMPGAAAFADFLLEIIYALMDNERHQGTPLPARIYEDDDDVYEGGRGKGTVASVTEGAAGGGGGAGAGGGVKGAKGVGGDDLAREGAGEGEGEFAAEADDDCLVCFARVEDGEAEAVAGAIPCECVLRLHFECLADWLEANGTCPICRQRFVAQVPGT